MSIVNVSAESEMIQTMSRGGDPRVQLTGMRWVRLVLACMFLALSGGIRWWQVRQVEAVIRDGRNSPFSLETLPMVLGEWRGEETAIDPKIARRTGATDLITRRYVDQRTGATLEAIILYGPSTEVYGHAPEVCYQAAGYEKVAGPVSRPVKSGTTEIPFRSLVYSKGEGGQADLHEVYYSWRFTHHWSPDMAGSYKRFERIPGMLKVHLARRVTDQERRDIGNPCESFLKVLLPEIERRLATATPAAEQTLKGVMR